MNRFLIMILILFMISGCSNPLEKDITTFDVNINNILVQGDDLVFKKNGNTYVATGEASKFKTLKETKKTEYQKYMDSNEEDRKKIKISWFIRFADYDGKIVIME